MSRNYQTYQLFQEEAAAEADLEEKRAMRAQGLSTIDKDDQQTDYRSFSCEGCFQSIHPDVVDFSDEAEGWGCPYCFTWHDPD